MWIKTLSVGKREEQPNMDGNVLAKRIVGITVRERATIRSQGKGCFFRKLFIDLIAFSVQYVPIGTGAVESVSSQPSSGPTFE